MGRKPENLENEPTANGQPATNNYPVAPPVFPPDPPVNSAPAVEKPKPMRAFTETESLARDLKDGTVSGFVGTGTTVQGEANFKGMMRIDGQLSGSIKSEKGTLIVSSGGKVDAKIEVAVANINGRINGDIIATERIELGRSAHVTGNISTPSLIIEQGAIFDGSCRMLQAQKTAHEEEAYVPKKSKAEATSDESAGSGSQNVKSINGKGSPAPAA
jgi:cytoskeletal protein CcmA (bactofilin family)